ncbi:uncharacterized protein LOC129909514 [Episyrphus balteatus]|uniref:uncharacterized protein LOC129909514 n=1 Tax=Episyrphus balteatus TaxID=286459 RepID=UPI002486BE4D|nr:uncharacterized protein LOC129909514 [Episyrphus balteatus]
MASYSSDPCVDLMRHRFYKDLEESRKATSAKNTVYIKDARYKALIKDVMTAKTTGKKNARDYWLLRRYDMILVDQKMKLFFPAQDPKSILLYVCDSELFDVLHGTHIKVGHGGRDRMMREIGSRYKNITRKDIETYINICELCQNNRGYKKKIEESPIIESECNSRYQVELEEFLSDEPEDVKNFSLGLPSIDSNEDNPAEDYHLENNDVQFEEVEEKPFQNQSEYVPYNCETEAATKVIDPVIESTSSVKQKEHPVFCKNKLKKRKLADDKLAEAKLEVVNLQKQLVQQEIEKELAQTKILEQEFEHKGKIQELERQHLLLKIKLTEAELENIKQNKNNVVQNQ